MSNTNKIIEENELEILNLRMELKTQFEIHPDILLKLHIYNLNKLLLDDAVMGYQKHLTCIEVKHRHIQEYCSLFVKNIKDEKLKEKFSVTFVDPNKEISEMNSIYKHLINPYNYNTFDIVKYLRSEIPSLYTGRKIHDYFTRKGEEYMLKDFIYDAEVYYIFIYLYYHYYYIFIAFLFVYIYLLYIFIVIFSIIL